jgi:hypothetical protein
MPATAGLSPQEALDATQSIGSALTVAQRTDAAGLANAAKDAYAAGFQITLILAGIVLMVVAAIVWRWLPDRRDTGSDINVEVHHG